MQSKGLYLLCLLIGLAGGLWVGVQYSRSMVAGDAKKTVSSGGAICKPQNVVVKFMPMPEANPARRLALGQLDAAIRAALGEPDEQRQWELFLKIAENIDPADIPSVLTKLAKRPESQVRE